ncbi:hypothetical protein BH23BAC1_BH23BAC1_19610 [soil metagenome]
MPFSRIVFDAAFLGLFFALGATASVVSAVAVSLRIDGITPIIYSIGYCTAGQFINNQISCDNSKSLETKKENEPLKNEILVAYVRDYSYEAEDKNIILNKS